PEPARAARRGAEERAPATGARRRRLVAFLAFVAALAVIAAVAIALLSANDGGGQTVQPVDKGAVREQIDGIRQFLDRNSR
ncbi:MAG: hypothetical protein ACM3UV_00590, partial [Nocardioidaceae bacterium]